MNVDIILQLLLAMGLGALVGMERGINEKTKLLSKSSISFGDIRTFSLLSLLGAMSIWLTMDSSNIFFIAGTLFIIGLFIVVYYSYSIYKEKQFGLTTELASIVTFFLGVFVMLGYVQIAIIMSIVLTFLLSSKGLIDRILEKVSREELNNTIKFAVISIVVLPLLPNEKFSISDILTYIGYTNPLNNSILNLDFLNFYGIWFFVVLMSAISYAGYIMSRVIGEKGSILASGAIGGLVSSTAVTASMSESSKKDLKNTSMYVVSTLLASTIMFVRVIIIVLFFNINMLSSIIYPSLFMLLGMILYMVYFYFSSKDRDLHIENLNFEEKKYSSPFSIVPALKFASFVVFIKFVAGVGALYKDVWGDYFFYILGIISGLADVDAISQTMAVDSIDGKVGLEIAAMTIIIAVISNNLVKGSIAMKFGEKKFGFAVMMGFVVSMIMGIVGMVFLKIT
ncbi:MAG: MgtC/SapB family protein [Candidatus Gracilibacteria bacterium]|nr:MgtC/SapB family protein [Candidatus Gracilibacteria bacterium]